MQSFGWRQVELRAVSVSRGAIFGCDGLIDHGARVSAHNSVWPIHFPIATPGPWPLGRTWTAQMEQQRPQQAQSIRGVAKVSEATHPSPGHLRQQVEAHD